MEGSEGSVVDITKQINRRQRGYCSVQGDPVP